MNKVQAVKSLPMQEAHNEKHPVSVASVSPSLSAARLQSVQHHHVTSTRPSPQQLCAKVFVFEQVSWHPTCSGQACASSQPAPTWDAKHPFDIFHCSAANSKDFKATGVSLGTNALNMLNFNSFQ